jgi:hypothetical protein
MSSIKEENKITITEAPTGNPQQAFQQNVAEEEAIRRSERINKELMTAFTFIRNSEKSVSFFGSARFKPTSEHYKEARYLAERIVKETGYAVVTGGGPGIMEAANRGAKESGGTSIGLNITLPHEQIKNSFLTDSLDFYYFFSRKVALSFSAEAYIFFPGGFGTLDELFELLTLIQTGKIPKVPIILMGSDYWQSLDNFIRRQMLNAHKSIDPADMKIYKITDNKDEVIEIIKKAPLRRE